ncbi:excalibur calcium-binding domain-containing protein [Actinobacillus pleuropneumoniae]|uniref:excalibur calcium-binding domain-containing protein n=1 Tax=Actinobacillus pleuropneumoniae TaxID=715 RepID=UPI003B018592
MKKLLVMLAVAVIATFAYAAEKFECGKRTCSQMNSCEEARFHLTQCGVSSLDRDKDGIPCESLCGGKKKKNG